MTTEDTVQFAEVFTRLRAVFPLRGEANEIQQIIRVYFRALSRFPIDDVDAGADVWMGKGSKFPKPAEWIQSIPRGESAIEELSPQEAREYWSALHDRFEGDPCSCVSCVAAGVSHRHLRFVPDCDENGQDLRGRIGKHVMTRGHWAHGDELVAYYRARDEFMALSSTLMPMVRKTMASMRTDTKKQVAAFRAENPGAVVEEPPDDDVARVVDVEIAGEWVDDGQEPRAEMTMESEWEG